MASSHTLYESDETKLPGNENHRKTRYPEQALSGGVAACPPVVDYGKEFQARAAEELVLLPQGSAVMDMLSDYPVMPEQARVCNSISARMRGRVVLNSTTEIRSSFGEISGVHVSAAALLWLLTMVSLTACDTVELHGRFRVTEGYFAANHTSIWGMKVG